MEMRTALGVNRTVHDACVSTFFTGIGNRRLGAVFEGGGVQLTSPPGWQKPRRPASKLEKIAVRAGTSRTADQVRSSALGKPCSPRGGRAHSTGNQRRGWELAARSLSEISFVQPRINNLQTVQSL